MAYLQELLDTQAQQLAIQQQNQTYIGLRPNEAYAQYFPTYEVTSPQYQVPIAWSLSQLGYRTNEVAYACISLKMKTISEAPVRIWDKIEEEFIDDGDNEEFFRFMEQPCPDITETDFHAANQMYLDIAGVLAWEKDSANDGTLKSVWPMMPQYCSYLRGEGKLLRAIRYQPYTGLPYLDIDRSKIVLMMYFDPNYFGLKPLSPTAVMADIIKVDNDMTVMLQTFIRNGAFVSGILSTEQTILEADARFAKERFRESHGGPNNAGDIVVVGKGMEFKPTNQTFREMVFPEVDARSETRICMGYSVPPILVSAKSGMDRATYSNYEQARKAWYEEYVTSQWKFLAERYTKDILPHFDTDTNHILRFDTKKVKALQEDRTNTWKRATEAYKARVIVRNTALVEMGLEQIGDSDPETGNEYYSTAMEQTSLSMEDNLDEPNAVVSKKPVLEKDIEVAGQDKMKVTKEEDEEEKAFRRYAQRRIDENKIYKIGLFEFKYISEKRQRQLLSEFGVVDPDAKAVLDGLMVLAEMIKSSRVTVTPVEPYKVPNINITANIEQGKTPEYQIIMPEQKTIEQLPPSVTVEVSPTPVHIDNKIDVKPADVKIPKKKREYQKVKRDMGNNIEGTITEIEYEDDK
jgi:phage portal protein BeeE